MQLCCFTMQEDRGSPLVCQDENGAWHLQGLLIYAPWFEGHGYPAIFLNVTSMADKLISPYNAV